MTAWMAVLLGLVQGMTEFLPVSSSGHLVLVESLFGVSPEQGLLFSVLLHVGTLLPVTWYLRRSLLEVLKVAIQPGRWFSRDLHDHAARSFRFVCIGTLVTTALALPFKGVFEQWFASPRAVGFALLGTTLLLLVSRWLPGGRPPKPLVWWQAVVVGVAQAVAVTPGISRSGSTIVAGLAVGIPREQVGACSFLLSVPAILGGLLLELRHTDTAGLDPWIGAIGMAVAACSGFLALRWTLGFLRQGRFWWFAFWTAGVALAALRFSPAT